jgi:hypothetical protein
MTDIGQVLWWFTGIALLAVVMILGAAFWAHARSAARDRLEPALETSGDASPAYNRWLNRDDD